jgi:hypothetical protein
MEIGKHVLMFFKALETYTCFCAPSIAANKTFLSQLNSLYSLTKIICFGNCMRQQPKDNPISCFTKLSCHWNSASNVNFCEVSRMRRAMPHANIHQVASIRQLYTLTSYLRSHGTRNLCSFCTKIAQNSYIISIRRCYINWELQTPNGDGAIQQLQA